MGGLALYIPPDVQYILQTLNDSGFAAYAVGGCVRDSLMGKTPKDWDVATSALPGQVARLFSRTFDTGAKHGTVTVVKNGANYEVTTFRLDGEYLDNRRPAAVSFGAALPDDLARRDFTMNAIAYHPREGFVDPFGGREDIGRRLIRGVGDPGTRFREDALRMLRALRFAGQLGFGIERDTYDAIGRNAALLRNISIERIRDEFTKLLASGSPDKLNALAETGILANGWPSGAALGREELAAAAALLPGFTGGGDAARYALLLIRRPSGLNGRAAVCAGGDGSAGEAVIYGGKPEIRRPSGLNGRTAVCANGDGNTGEAVIRGGKPENGAASARSFMTNMRFDTDTVMKTARIVNWAKEPVAAGGYALRTFLSKCGPELFPDVMAVKKAVGPQTAAELSEAELKAGEILARGDCLSLRGLAVRGDDLAGMGLSGREIGAALERLLDAVLKEPEKNQKALLMEEALRYKEYFM
ncbi:MAG: polynucleotide adenylyltransferase [Firmicutes bacterium]|nr:polynucleotide adenylyltransferase [Bacillota bacterium]